MYLHTKKPNCVNFGGPYIEWKILYVHTYGHLVYFPPLILVYCAKETLATLIAPAHF
jgi:hypothetical protein